MVKSKIVVCTILSLFLVGVCLPAGAFCMTRGRLDRAYVPLPTAGPREKPAPSPPKTQPVTGESGSGSGKNVMVPIRTMRNGGYYVAPSSPPAAPVTPPTPHPSDPPGELPSLPDAPSWMTADEARAFILLNETRIGNSVPPVEAHRGLTEQARLKALDMVENNYFAHNSPLYGSAANMIRQAGIPFSALGENLSRAGNVYQAHLQLEYSTQGHRQILLNADYNYVGIGVVPLQSTPGLNMVQIFIR